ncbi:Arf-GAP with Rho-GAP domain, ANK repeat and PH domain-containing protein 2 [Lamellibrachia satsuma]|nr:Arf-GAP with Rho-GAP domain, ANK repeat and PH domain-containing protein 2 [Lamellibrachia satsuma]
MAAISKIVIRGNPLCLHHRRGLCAGLSNEGIYRHSGQHSRITELLKLFQTDARSVHLRLEEYTVHDVCTVMKRFLRYLDDPVLTHALYPKWLEATAIEERTARLQWYKYLLGELPRVNYMALKKLTTHLCRVSEQQQENKMNLINIASIFGPVLMAKKEEDGALGGYGGTNEQISTVREILDNHQWLFEVKENELEHERKIEEAIRKIEQLSTASNKGGASDLLLGIYLHGIDGQVIMLKVPPTMTAEQVLQYVVRKADLDTYKHWGIFEVICGRELQRPLHYSEKVLDVTLRWGAWPDEFCRDNCLCVKENTIYEKVDLVFDQAHGSLYGELRFSERKGFKKFHFEFSQYKLMYHKDTKGSSPLCSWNVEDLTVYVGVQAKRSPPTRWGFTFIVTKEPVSRGKDNPFFGYSACCDNEVELYRWIAAILHAQHSGGLESMASSPIQGAGIQGTDRTNSPSILNMPVPLDAGFNHSPKPHRTSLFRKFRKK